MEYVGIHSIYPNENNPRFIRKEDFQKLKKSIASKQGRRVFEARPCIVSTRTGENIIIAGNTRYRAAVELGWEEVPCSILDNLTETEEQEIIVRDNVNNGQWEFDILASTYDTFLLEEWGVSIPEVLLKEEEKKEKTKKVQLCDKCMKEIL